MNFAHRFLKKADSIWASDKAAFAGLTSFAIGLLTSPQYLNALHILGLRGPWLDKLSAAALLVGALLFSRRRFRQGD